MSGTSIPAWARPGARVVCVVDGGHEQLGEDIKRPAAGQEYTIRHVAVIGGEAGCWLEEIHNSISVDMNEPGWCFDRFIPVIPYPG